MNAFLSEFARLYHVDPSSDAHSSPPVGADGLVRCAVLELAHPADWRALGAVWQGVQADLGLPAPAIAINGSDGYQLWFSWLHALPTEEATQFVQLLCQRYLPAIAAQRLRCFPGTLALAPQAVRQVHDEQWSAFIAPDLAAVFADEPWLDRDPGQEAQAQLLARLESMRAQDYAKALQNLQPTPPAQTPGAITAPVSIAPSSGTTHYPTETPAAFLQAVMEDASAPLALRVQAATALLHIQRPV